MGSYNHPDYLAKRRKADKARRKRKARELEEARRIARVVRAMTDAAWATYADHERSTSDSYLKKRINNAVNQVVTRAINDLFPEWVAKCVDKDGWSVEKQKWGITFDDATRIMATIEKAGG